mgnify:CR=1 FL=1
MLTLGQIQLRGFFILNQQLVIEWLESYAADEKNDQWGMRQVLEIHDAYLTITGYDPTTLCLDDFAGFRGFLNTEMG